MQKFSRRNHEYAIKISNLYAGGLVIVDLAFLPVVISSNPLKSSGQFTLDTFSIALPLLVGTLIINAVEIYNPSRTPSSLIAWLIHIPFIVGLITNYVGFCALILEKWHTAGVLFIISSLVTLVICGIYTTVLKESSEE